MSNTPPENSVFDWWNREEENEKTSLKCGYPQIPLCNSEEVYSVVKYVTSKSAEINTLHLCYKHHVRRKKNKRFMISRLGDKYSDKDISWDKLE